MNNNKDCQVGQLTNVDDDHQQGPEPVAEDQARDVDRHSGSSPPSHRAVSS